MVKEQREAGQWWTENIRNVYGIYLADIKAEEMDGTVQEILYKTLGENGLTRAEADEKMEQFINEVPYTYFNVAGRDNMSLVEGAKDALSLCNNKDWIVGLATPLIEKQALNMMERTKIDPKQFKFAEYGAYKKDAQSLLMAAISSAKANGAEPDADGVFVSASPNMLSVARAVRIKTVGVGPDDRFTGMELDAKIKSLKEIKKGIQQATR
jgi:phosphoglycolate phosphatase-like HAD superfamily hydrolase